jgi:aspartokinase/homoserine dehydrogenase 1
MKILKFGGTSLGTAERVRAVIDIITSSKKEHGDIAVVVSAFEGVTDRLIEAGNQAFRGEREYIETLKELAARHIAVADELTGSAAHTCEYITASFVELEEFLHGIWILGEITNRTLDFVMSYGELLSSTIIADGVAFSGLPARATDSRMLIRTDLSYGSAQVNFELTNWNILSHFRSAHDVQIITGFIACGPDNETTTLGRGGSDYTASIVGAALNASEIEIWTHVDGVMTADPRKVPSALSLESLTFEEALELSYFGAKVIHPPTMIPALQKQIPLRIRNSFHPEHAGTLISGQPDSSQRSTVKGIACIEEISLLKITSSGTVRTADIASRIFAALTRKNIEATLLTQSSSEHSMCLAFTSDCIRTAREVLELEFRVELHHGQISAITVEHQYSVIAVVGEQIHSIPGVTGKIFETLGKNGIKLHAIAHGSSARNLTLVVRRSDLQKAMNALHDNLFLSRQKTINLFLAGPGVVGSALLDLLREQEEYARETLHICFRVLGVSNSRTMILNGEGIDLARWRDLLQESPRKANLAEFSRAVLDFNAANSIVIDCTGNNATVQQYLDLLRSSVSVITSSKLANTSSQDFYRRLRDAAKQSGAQFRYSTNVGAALPIIDSIRTIIQSGDAIERIEAVLSGTLSFIFNRVNAGKKFSESVLEAQRMGFTEPDPRIDLSGTDVARKLLILVREAGYTMELDDIVLEPYLPAEILKDADLPRALIGADAVIEKQRAAARTRNCSLLIIARFENGRAHIGAEEIPAEHPFYHLSGNDNIVSLTTRRLYRQPLVVRGGGAGAQLTASGIFNDIINVSHAMN